MRGENPSFFTRAIKEHLELKQRNARLDRVMPIEQYKGDDPLASHPSFKSEQQARVEDAEDASDPIGREREDLFVRLDGEEQAQESAGVAEDSGFWLADSPPEFDWGD